MPNEPVIAHEQRVYAVLESTFRTAVLPATGQSMEIASLDMGPAMVGTTRPRKDKTVGRDMTLGFVEGRVEPIAFSLEKSVKSRASATTVPEESPLLKAAGLVETVGGSDVAYSIASAPTLNSLALLSVLGAGSAAYFAEHGLGGVVKQLQFAGGDSELMLKASGAFAQKEWLGQSTGTLIDASDTTLALDTPAHAYRFGLGYLQIGSEVVLVTAINYTTGILTVVRAQAGTTAAAHTSATLYPYQPTFTPTGVSPISEANCTVTLDGTATRCTKFSIDITTGVDHRPGETGSKYIQGIKIVRIEVKPTIEFVLTKELVDVIGKVNQRKSVALTIVCGTGAGSIVTFSMPYCEIEPMPVPAPPNDISLVSPALRVRGNSGNDSLTVTFS